MTAVPVPVGVSGSLGGGLVVRAVIWRHERVAHVPRRRLARAVIAAFLDPPPEFGD